MMYVSKQFHGILLSVFTYFGLPFKSNLTNFQNALFRSETKTKKEKKKPSSMFTISTKVHLPH